MEGLFGERTSVWRGRVATRRRSGWQQRRIFREETSPCCGGLRTRHVGPIRTLRSVRAEQQQCCLGRRRGQPRSQRSGSIGHSVRACEVPVGCEDVNASHAEQSEVSAGGLAGAQLTAACGGQIPPSSVWMFTRRAGATSRAAKHARFPSDAMLGKSFPRPSRPVSG